MALTVAELAELVRESNRRLTEPLDRLADTVHDLEGAVRKLEVRVTVVDDRLESVRKIGWALTFWALGMLGSAFYVVNRAARLEECIVSLQANFKEFKGEFKVRDKQLEDSLVSIQKESRAQDVRLDRAISALDRIEKTLTQPRPGK